METGFHIPEVFPKQDSLEGMQHGNYVNLPLFGEDVPNGRTVFLDAQNGYLPYVDQWEFLKTIVKVTPEKLDAIIQNLNPEAIAAEAQPGTSGSSDGLEIVLECDFIKYCRQNARDLKEPFWYAMVSNLCRFEGGREKIHEYSRPYQKYSEAETDKKIEHAIKDSGPHTCQWIKDNGFECPRYGQCDVRSPAALAHKRNSDEPSEIHLAQIEDSEFEGRLVTTELMVAGIGITYGVPKDVTISWQEQNGDKLTDKTQDFTIRRDSRLLLDCYKQGDAQLNAILRKALLDRNPAGARVEVKSRYTLRELLAVPKISRVTDGEMDGNYEYKNFIVYYVDDAETEDSGTVIRSNVFYRATGVALSEPKRQVKTMLVTELHRQDAPWQSFKLTPEVEERFRHFKPDDNSIDGIRAKLRQITGDVTRNITKRYGNHRQRMLLVHLLTLSSPISCRFDGEVKPGWLEVMITGICGIWFCWRRMVWVTETSSKSPAQAIWKASIINPESIYLLSVNIRMA